MSDKELVLERKDQELGGIIANGLLRITPGLDEDYWSYRVQLSEEQAVLGFPKFSPRLIGIGFAVEKDWNTNLPTSCSAQEIFEHIKHNKCDDSIEDADVIRAIEMIRTAVKETS